MKVPNDGIKLSVLVTYNHKRNVGGALKSLLKQDHLQTIELVIADDASTESTLKVSGAAKGLTRRASSILTLIREFMLPIVFLIIRALALPILLKFRLRVIRQAQTL